MNRKTLCILGVGLIAAATLAFWAGTRMAQAPSPSPSHPEDTNTGTYYCSMHPHIRLPHPGTCSICGMDLIPLRESSPAHGEDDPGPRALEMSELAMRLADVETAKVERRAVTAKVSMVGKIDFDETEVRTITARVGGRLDRLYVNYTGVPVTTGDHLVDIYSPQLYAAQQELLEASRSLKQPDGDSSEYLKRASRGTLEAVRKKLSLLGLSDEQIADIEKRQTPSEHLIITAPVSGVVVEKLANEGDYVDTGTPVYRVANLEKLWVKLDAYESDLPWVRYGQAVTFQAVAYPGEVFTGTVSFVDWVVNHRTRTIKVRLNVNNPGGRFKPGMFVRADVESALTEGGRVMEPALAGKWVSPMHPEIVKDGPGQCDICGMDLVPAEKLFRVVADGAATPLVIPTTAPLVTGRRAVVYVRRPGTSIFEGRDVVLGPRAGEHYVVRDGLEEGEEVVVRGNFKIDSALQIQAKPSMMHPAGGDHEAHDHGAHQSAAPQGSHCKHGDHGERENARGQDGHGGGHEHD